MSDERCSSNIVKNVVKHLVNAAIRLIGVLSRSRLIDGSLGQFIWLVIHSNTFVIHSVAKIMLKYDNTKLFKEILDNRN